MACIPCGDSNTVGKSSLGATRMNSDHPDAQSNKRACCAATRRAALEETLSLLAEIRSDIQAGADPVARLDLARARLHQRLRESAG